jgi:hypothetical protein
MAEQAASYKCEVCGAVFKDADSLTKHMAVHDSHETEAPLERGTDKPTMDPIFSDTGPTPPHP